MRLTSTLRDRLVQTATGAGLALMLAVLALASPTPAQAEGRIRIAEQYGIVYLLLNVARDQQLIEKHGKAEGVDISVEWAKLSGGSAVNDALLSGAVDIAGAGVGPLLTIWDRTAVPAVGVSVQSRVLQLASAKLWGDAQYNKLDKISVALPHPDAAAAIIAGGTEITGHFGNPPFQEQELAENPKARIVLNSYDVLGGPSSSTVLFATEKFRRENPKTYKAFQEALKEAASFAAANPEQAADIYLRVTGAKQDRDFLIKVIKNPDVQFKLAPQNTYALAQFMHKVGAIKNAPASWRDYFFDDPVTAQGS